MKHSISLPSEQEHFIIQQLETGRYSTASEVVRDALRLLQTRETAKEKAVETLRQQINLGFASLERGEGQEMEEAFAELEETFRNSRKA